MPHTFSTRRDAGRLLGEHLAARHLEDPVVLGLPRGGVPVAFEVAAALGAPLDVFVVRKLGVPRREELAMGAIASGGIRVLVPEVVEDLRVPPELIDAVTDVERRELERREREYRGDRVLRPVAGRTVILIDDGAATGASMRAAIQAVRALNPARIVAAAPVMSAEGRDRIREVADAVEVLAVPEPFHGVGVWYDDFSQTSDEEVRMLLAQAARQADA